MHMCIYVYVWMCVCVHAAWEIGFLISINFSRMSQPSQVLCMQIAFNIYLQNLFIFFTFQITVTAFSTCK